MSPSNTRTAGPWPAPKDLYLDRDAAVAVRTEARNQPSWDLDPRQLCLLELLLSGALAPLNGYLDAAAHTTALESAILPDGAPCPWPLALEVTEAFAAERRPGETIALRDPEGLLVALLEIDDVYRVEPEALAAHLFAGPPVLGAAPAAGADWARSERCWRLGGRVVGVEPVFHYDFAGLRLPPEELQQRIQRRGWRRVLGVLTRRPLGPGEHALVERRARELEASVLLLPEAGMAEAGDVRYYARMRALEAALPRFGEQAAEASIVPLPRPLGSPREIALRHLVARNHGATDLLLLDLAPGEDAGAGLEALDASLGLTPVAGGRPFHVPDRGIYCLAEECADSDEAAFPCGSDELLARLGAGERIPEWLGWPEIVTPLSRAWPPRASQGFTLFLTGLSGSGKSTIARALLGRLMEEGSRRVTLLDGDIVRKNLSSELGFSREHRDLNIRRIGFVAAEITKNGGVGDLRAHRAVREHAARGARGRGTGRRLRRDPRRHAPRGVRGTRPQGALRQGPGRRDPGVHGHQRPLRDAGASGGPPGHEHEHARRGRAADRPQAACARLPGGRPPMTERIVSFNVNGIRARPHQLEAVVARHAPRVIGLQETKVEDDAFPVEIAEQLDRRVHFHGQKTHYGVALLDAGTPTSVQCGFPWAPADAQRRFIASRTALADGTPLTVLNGYFPQGENRDHPEKFPNKRAFYADVLRYLEEGCDPSAPVALMGDMNVAPVDADIGIGEPNRRRWLREGKTCFLPEEREWLDALLAWGLTDSFRLRHPEVDDRFSWFDYRSRGFERDPKRGLRIDLLLVSAPLAERCVDAGIDYEIRAMERPSDHCPIWAEFE